MPNAERQAVNPWLVAISVMFGTFMEVLDTTVVNVALPHIAGSLSATVDESTWALTSYLVSNAIILPMTGWLATTLGRKRLLLSAVAGFGAASVLCGLAPNLPMLIVFRVIQGATGGTMQPLSQAVMLEAFEPQDRGKAMGFWGLGVVVAPMVGPVLGGWLTDNYSWRWVFYINLPVCILCVFLVQTFVHDPPYLRRERMGVDYWGIGLLALSIGTFQVVMDKGQQEDWLGSTFIRTLLAIAVGGFVALIIRELMAKEPVVNLRIFRNRTYAAGVTVMTTVGFVLYGSLVLLPVFLQTLLGYPALQAGIAMAPRGLGAFIAMPIVGNIVSRFDPRKMLMIGIAGTAWTLYDLSRLNLNAGYWDIFWPQFIQGISMSLLFVPLTTTTMAPIPREDTGNATSLFNFMRNVGGSMGIAMATTVLARTQYANILRLRGDVTGMGLSGQRYEAIRQGLIGQGRDPYTAGREAYTELFLVVRGQAAMLSFIHLFQLLAVIFLCVLPLLLFMRRPKGEVVAAAH